MKLKKLNLAPSFIEITKRIDVYHDDS